MPTADATYPDREDEGPAARIAFAVAPCALGQIGRASCRERV